MVGNAVGHQSSRLSFQPYFRLTLQLVGIPTLSRYRVQSQTQCSMHDAIIACVTVYV